MNIYTIYKATNKINGKCYIGFDSKWSALNNRKYTHEKEALYKGYKNYWYDLSKDLRGFGFHNFIWEPIYQSADYAHTLHVMEPLFIIEYNSKRPNGYNMTDGGDGRKAKHTPETIAKMKQRIPWNKGIKSGPQSEERKEKMRITLTGKIRGPYKGNKEYSPKWKLFREQELARISK